MFPRRSLQERWARTMLALAFPPPRDLGMRCSRVGAKGCVRSTPRMIGLWHQWQIKPWASANARVRSDISLAPDDVRAASTRRIASRCRYTAQTLLWLRIEERFGNRALHS